jgi:large subunit ribosomal protein L24
VSNVGLLVKDDDGNEVTTRIGHRRDEVTKRRPDGTEYTAYRSVRIARRTGEEI